MIVLVGFMGAGKTTVGRRLALMAGLPFIDVDENIERAAMKGIREIFVSEGEPAFRSRERAAISEALGGDEGVVALGGGALDDPLTRTDLEWHDVVHLDVSFSEALRRIGGDDSRPMLARSDPKALYDERARHYERVARVSVTTDGKRPEAIAKEVAGSLGIEVAGDVERVVVNVQPPYDVVIGEQLLTRLDEFLPDTSAAEKAAIVTHDSLRSLADPVAGVLRRRNLEVGVIDVPEGERAKSLDRVALLYEAFADAVLHRRDLVVAVGGGVITDLAGFAASTYNRGMSVIHVPTTLLGQVDAAIGGKTGVNLETGKNLVGTIHQPSLVVCDVATLRSLPEEEFVSGLAEVAKYGFIDDPDLLDLLMSGSTMLLAREPSLLREVVARCAAAKAAIVAVDEKETGVREVLNYGHTFAHAIERSSDFSIRHGHAVALGMMAAAYLAHELRRIETDVVDRHTEVLEALGLPVRADLDLEVLEKAWVRDKKYRGGMRFVLLSSLGKAEPGVTADRAAIARSLERLRR
jgi:3-dehydroquinate synthase/shikimate kinase/3-dehydroquinate synthase